jgi:transmembrane sensor
VHSRAKRDAAIRAEAAAWLARIHSDAADPKDIASFQIWLAEDMRHREAFDAVTQVWEAVGGLGQLREESRPRRSAHGLARRAVLAAAGIAVAAAVAWSLLPPRESAQDYATGIGEQRRLALEDGSLAILDTATTIRVAYDGRRRAITLLRGRAHFDVARDVGRPFVVSAGQRQVTALGTAFDVDRGETSIAVMLVRGHISIASADTSAPAQAVDLTIPGEHVVFDGPDIAQRNRLDLNVATAWQSGRAVFNDQPVSLAVAEMNRYSRRPIIVDGDAVARMRISGTYGIGDTEAFATSLAALLPIRVVPEPTRIILSAAPGAPARRE